MSKFEVKIVKIDDVIDHPNADRLSLVKIAGYSVVSGKLEDGSHRYKAGDLVAYCPENSIIPEYLLRRGYWDEKNDKGMLGGPLGNRVRPIKLRDILSEGIMFPTISDLIDGVLLEGPVNDVDVLGSINKMIFVEEGDEVSEFLGITKWIPEIPSSMDGDVIPSDYPIGYDIENIKKYDKVLEDDEMIYITEKLHGTFCQIGYVAKFDENLFEGHFFVTSKGLGSKGLIFKDTEENRTKNIYVKTLLKNMDKLAEYVKIHIDSNVIFFGEIFGKGIQDLQYGMNDISFRIFDVNIDKKYLDFIDLLNVVEETGVDQVPLLYAGRYSKEIVDRETNGNTLINGTHIREGCVIKPQTERENRWIGRVILKSVSEKYLAKNNRTEYN